MWVFIQCLPGLESELWKDIFSFETEFINLKECQVGLNDTNLKANGIQIRNKIGRFWGRELLALEIRFQAREMTQH